MEINDELFKGAVYRKNRWNITVARLIKRNYTATSFAKDTRRLKNRNSDDETLVIGSSPVISQRQAEPPMKAKIKGSNGFLTCRYKGSQQP